MIYQNENLAPGNLGYFFVVLSFCAALLSLAAYLFYARRDEEKSWQRLGRSAFIIHGIAVAGVFTTLFYLIHAHQFQYNYVWSHSSRDLPWYFMISCFWEGQEGSFLLWTIWDFILGLILIRTTKSWEAPVMVTICLAQVMLTSMLLGLDQVGLFGHAISIPKIGSNPFLLLRKAMPGIPLFARPNYVQLIADGRGLNALLQNYWMVIHPPILFLGFASTIVPFAFAAASLWNRRYKDWVRPALPWAIFNGMLLGTGILMGGAWAYEALSFGGFWAWDPVENASLVPWLLAMGGIHTMMIYRARKSSLLISYILVILAFILILYSTFLTRSGILGDSSVHSFTDLGLSGQLLLFMFLFIILASVLLAVRWKAIPRTEKEESIYSREFWMFIGSLILSLAALHVISVTSIPVFNKVAAGLNSLFHSSLKTNIAQPTDPIGVYHLLQIPFAIMVAFLTAIGQYFRYHVTLKKLFWKRAGISLLIAVVLTILLNVNTGFSNTRYFLLLLASMYAVVANADVLSSFLKQKNFHLSGAAVSHIGFGLLLMGALIANANKETISLNTEGFQALSNVSASEQMENKVLFKNKPVLMSDYRVTFVGDSTFKNHTYFKVNYERMGKDLAKPVEQFTLYPFILLDKSTGQFTTTSPSTRHYLTKDIFTHITAASNKDLPEYQVKYDTFFTYEVSEGEEIRRDSFLVKVKGIAHETDSAQQKMHRLTMTLDVSDGFTHFEAKPQFILNGNDIEFNDAEVHDFGLKFRYNMVHPETKKHELVMLKGRRPAAQFITLKATVFPMINLLWTGCIVMFLGFLISLFRRVKEYKV